MIIGLVVSCSSISRTFPTSLIKGQWKAEYDNIHMVLTFEKDSGYIVYLPKNKTFHFKYTLKNESILVISNGKEKSSHLIKYLTKSKLKMEPYPAVNNSESIDLIDHVEFER